ncbi:MAG TPA: family 20 glycosylhydrolase [Rhizomicrobium sp.]|nr:family 20 glycosylhydrolase [Rhizomicrobium sp.]
MKTGFSFGALLVASLLLGCQTGNQTASQPANPSATPARAAASAAPSIIPAPASATPGQGHFTVTAATQVLCAGKQADCAWVAGYFTDLLKRARGLQLNTGTGEQSGAISLRLSDEKSAGIAPEAYRLDITPGGVTVTASSRAGLLYGAVSLWQLLTMRESVASSIELASVHITDAPRFAMRGLMVDSSRHFQSAAFIKSFLDDMVLHKLNVFHWHLTDDQGWRIEIKKYPRLTSIGAWRTPDEAGLKDIDPATGKPRPYGGFYTQEQIREIVAYAKDRNITIIPEIEMPGHATAAIFAYPQLGSGDAPKGVETGWGIYPQLYNVDDSTFAFLEDVLTEVMGLFPSEYIHIGGDEAIKDQWKASAKIQAQIKALNVADEKALQGYFTARIEKFLSAHGRRLIGWDEILEGGVPPSASITSWHGVDGGVVAAKSGHDAVLSPEDPLYFDWRQAAGPGEAPGAGRVNMLRKVYAFNPAPDSLTAEQQRHIAGIQANIWTEYLPQEELVANAAFPRAAALAELAWSPAQASKDWDGFMARIPAQLARYRALDIPHSESAVKVKVDSHLQSGQAVVTLANQVNFGEIHYTVDGSPPTLSSPLYRAPLTLPLPARVSAGVFYQGRLVTYPTASDVTRESLARRDSQELTLCENRRGAAVLDDAPKTGPRAVFWINATNPCWIWEKADLTGVSDITAAVGQITASRRPGAMLAPSTPDGELEVHLDSCEGERIAVLPLAPAVNNDAVTVLKAAMTPRSGVHDVCLAFTRAKPDPVWAINWVQLGPPVKP